MGADLIGDVITRAREILLIEKGHFQCTAFHLLDGRDHKIQSEFIGCEIRAELIELELRFGVIEMIHVTKAARIIVGQIAWPQWRCAFEDEMRVLVRRSCGRDEPCAGHAQVREKMGAVVETEVEHFAFAMGGGEGAFREI